MGSIVGMSGGEGMSDIFGIAPEDKACLECEMIKEAIKATEQRVVEDVVVFAETFHYMPDEFIEELRKKYDVQK